MPICQSISAALMPLPTASRRLNAVRCQWRMPGKHVVREVGLLAGQRGVLRMVGRDDARVAARGLEFVFVERQPELRPFFFHLLKHRKLVKRVAADGRHEIIVNRLGRQPARDLVDPALGHLRFDQRARSRCCRPRALTRRSIRIHQVGLAEEDQAARRIRRGLQIRRDAAGRAAQPVPSALEQCRHCYCRW